MRIVYGDGIGIVNSDGSRSAADGERIVQLREIAQ